MKSMGLCYFGIVKGAFLCSGGSLSCISITSGVSNQMAMVAYASGPASKVAKLSQKVCKDYVMYFGCF